MSKHISEKLIIGTGYRFKDQWVTTNAGHYIASSDFFGTIHSLPLLLSYDAAPFKNRKKLRSVKLNFGIGAFINRMRYQEPIGGRAPSTVSYFGNTVTSSFDYFEPRYSFSIEPYVNIST